MHGSNTDLLQLTKTAFSKSRAADYQSSRHYNNTLVYAEDVLLLGDTVFSSVCMRERKQTTSVKSSRSSAKHMSVVAIAVAIIQHTFSKDLTASFAATHPSIASSKQARRTQPLETLAWCLASSGRTLLATLLDGLLDLGSLAAKKTA